MIEKIIVFVLVAVCFIYVGKKLYTSYKKSVSGPVCGCSNSDSSNCTGKTADCNCHKDCFQPDDLKNKH